MTPTFEQFGIFVACILILINFWFSYRRDQRLSAPQQREVRINSDCATREEFDEHVKTNRATHVQIFTEIKERDVDAHKRIDQVVKEFNEQLRALPNEIVALLKNTGAIK